MKWVLIFCVLFSVNCASKLTSQLAQNSSNQNNSVNQNSNNQNSLWLEDIRIQNEKVEKMEIQNERFKIVPEEFRNVDFENFTYPTEYPKKTVTLKNGEFEYENTKSLGGGWFSFGKVYFVDLTNDDKKEAIVLLWRVDCGGSCDGGAVLMYVYKAKQSKPEMILNQELGSEGYGCGLKSLTVREKKIVFEIYGRCDNKMESIATKEENSNTGKFSSIGYTEFTFGFNGKKIVREKMVFFAVGKLSHLNYRPEISIND